MIRLGMANDITLLVVGVVALLHCLERTVNLCGDSILVVHPLFQEEGDGSTPISPLQMTVESIGFDQARLLNERWHSRLPRFGVGSVPTMPFLCFAATYQSIAYAAAIWSNPVARNLPQQEWLELRRLAVSPDSPRNTCSWMLGVMRRLIIKMKPSVRVLVSYQDLEVHSGTIYKAAGWQATTINKDGNWTRPNRSRPRSQSDAAKQRWECPLPTVASPSEDTE